VTAPGSHPRVALSDNDVSDTAPGRTPAIGALAVGIFAAEGLLSVAVARGLGLPSTLGWHLLILVVSGMWLFRPSVRHTRYGLLLWMTTAACGPLGGAGVCMAMALERVHARHATSLDEWHASLFPPTGIDEQAELWRRIGQRAHDQPAAADITPFLDVLTFGSVPQRQAVIAIIAQQFDPAFAPALRAALRDEHNVIRVQAATAIARLEQQFFERTVELETRIAGSPEDADAVLALASHYDDQAFAGLFDPSRELQCRVKAADLYAQRLELRPDDQATEFRMARLLLRRGLVADAEPRFRRLATAAYPAATLWLMECLFALGRYDQLRQTAVSARVDDARPMAPDVQATLDFWAGTGATA
jgi:polysaccharide biosynthesis protein PelE